MGSIVEEVGSAVLAGGGLDSPRLLAVLDHVAHAVFVKDRELRWVFLNEAAEKLMGFPREEMLGKTDHDYFPASEADFFREKDLEMFRTGKTVVIEQERLTDGQGEHHFLATTKTPLRNAAGEVTHLVGIVHDITRLVRAEEALRKANEDLERRVAERTRALEAAQEELVRSERLAVLGRLAGGVAHQIRNPLGAIENATALITRHSRDPESTIFRESIRILQEESAHANRIVNDLVSYARIRTPAARSVPLKETLRELVGSFNLPIRIVNEGTGPPSTGPVAILGPSRSQSVTIELTLLDVPDAFVDELQTHEALRNLIRNGVEATPKGGTLHVALDQADADFLRVVVQDEGLGIPEAVRSRMFEPLVTSKPTGLGLGLVTAQALVTSQGGRIAWSSHEGVGTRFEVFLPRSRETVRSVPHEPVDLPLRSA
jgi:two-component system, LuxR family, sensor kinase FixL